MYRFEVIIWINNKMSTMRTAVMADSIHLAYELAYAQYGRENVMSVRSL